MIRIPVSLAELEELITTESATWLERAAERTEAFAQAGAYNESSSIWSEVKGVYMALQHNKCAYCGRQLEDPEFGKIEHDIEHYRPKNPVKKWPTVKIATERGIHYDFPVGDAWLEGYFLLAYNVLNYVTACKVCNTPLKSNYFPIAGDRGPQSDDPLNLQAEQPYLLYPLGDIDADPEQLITFVGVVPVPCGQTDHDRRRAEVTIDFFELDTRETLLAQRARKIVTLALALLLLEENPLHAAVARRAIVEGTEPSSPHTNCGRAYVALFEADRPRAEAILDEALKYLESIGE